MLRTLARRTSTAGTRREFASESAPDRKVAILGAAGGIGQPLSLLMKLNPLVSRLALYDIAGTPGVAADVSHINTRSEVNFCFILPVTPCFTLFVMSVWFLTLLSPRILTALMYQCPLMNIGT